MIFLDAPTRPGQDRLRHSPVDRHTRSAFAAFGIAGGDGDLHGAGREVVECDLAFAHDFASVFCWNNPRVLAIQLR